MADYYNNRVVELPAGSSTQQTVPFTGLGSEPYGVATDAARDVFVADTADQVLEMPAGSSTQESLPYVAGGSPQGIAVDAAGDVFLSAAVGGTAWELPVLTPPTVSKVTPAEDRHTAGSRSPSAAPGSHRARASRSAKATAR